MFMIVRTFTIGCVVNFTRSNDQAQLFAIAFCIDFLSQNVIRTLLDTRHHPRGAARSSSSLTLPTPQTQNRASRFQVLPAQ